MLDSLRKGAGTWFVKAFLFLLVASFAVWGVGDIFRGRTDTALITVGDVKIEPQEFTDAFNREMRRMSQAIGQSLDREQARAFGLVDRTLQQVVTQTLYDTEAADLDLIASREMILQQIRENPAFQNEFKQFDRFRFEQLLRENGFSEASFIAANQRDLTRAQLFEAVAGGAQPPKALVEFFYKRQNEKRVAELLTVPNASFENVGEPDQAAVEKFHAEHATRFTAPEYRAISFVTLSPDDLLEEVRVSDAEIAEEYQARLPELSVAETRQVEQILFDAEEPAKQAAERIKAGEDFYKVAQEAAGQNEAAVRLGEQRREDLLPEAADAVFALPKGEVSAPVKTAFGWHLFRVTAITPGHKPTLEEAKAKLAEELKRRRAAETMFDMANRVDDALGGGASLEEIAQQFKLRFVKLDAVDAEGKNAQGQPIESLPQSPELLREAFTAEKGADDLQLREFQQGGYFIVRVDDVTAPALRPLEQVRAEAVEAWKAERRSEAAEKRANELVEKARQGDLKAIAAEAGFAYVRTDPATRQEAAGLPTLSIEAAQALFKLQPGEAATAPTREGDGQVVLKLVEVTPADPAADAAGMERLRSQLRASIADDLLAGFRDALEQDVAITVDQAALNAMFDSGR
jgi:peptidyl-prolyl cis-trans isomerase D